MVLCGNYASKAVEIDAVVSLPVVLGDLMRCGSGTGGVVAVVLGELMRCG